MYFDGSSAGTELSPGQGYVMRSNPWVWHPDAADEAEEVSP